MPSNHRCYAGANLLHPAPGRVQVSDVIEIRLGTGQNKGHVFITSSTFAGCLHQLQTARDCTRFDMASPAHCSIS
jgi:hypothetical protein